MHVRFQDPTKNLLLIGSNGTGKTLALVAALKMKVAHYKRNRTPIKLLVCMDSDYKSTGREGLLEDFKTKYGLKSVLEEYDTEPMSLIQIQKGFLKGDEKQI